MEKHFSKDGVEINGTKSFWTIKRMPGLLNWSISLGLQRKEDGEIDGLVFHSQLKALEYIEKQIQANSDVKIPPNNKLLVELTDEEFKVLGFVDFGLTKAIKAVHIVDDHQHIIWVKTAKELKLVKDNWFEKKIDLPYVRTVEDFKVLFHFLTGKNVYGRY